MESIETECKLYRLQEMFKHIKEDVIDDYILLKHGTKTYKYVLNDYDLYDKTEKWGDILWKTLEQSMTLEQVLQDIYHNYFDTNVIKTRYNSFDLSRYNRYLKNTFENRRNTITDLFIDRGLSIEIIDTHILQRYTKDTLSMMLMPIKAIIQN
jgi:hypothetical protein